MSPALLRLAALALPVAGLAAAWGWTQVRSQQGSEWEVPVAASGPRASLRGRYVVFRYDWGLPEDVDLGAVRALCVEGTAPNPRPVRPTGPDDSACRVLVRAAADGGRFSGLQGGVLYVPQEQVPGIRRQLADPSLGAAVRVRVRVNDSGAITPLSLSFVRKPAA